MFIRGLDIYGSRVTMEDYRSTEPSTSKAGGFLSILTIFLTALLVGFKVLNIFQEVALE